MLRHTYTHKCIKSIHVDGAIEIRDVYNLEILFERNDLKQQGSITCLRFSRDR